MAKGKKGYHQGEFTPSNPEKYIGTYPITARSSWEFVFMNKCDTHPNIHRWASESIKIPYWNPMKPGKHGVPNTIYVPDFYIEYVDKDSKMHRKIIEIKPLKESVEEKAKSKHSQAALAINRLKWQAAKKWCSEHGVGFEVMTEIQMFRQKSHKKK